MTDSETDELPESVLPRNYVTITGNRSEKDIQLASSVGARAVQLVLTRAQRDVAVRFTREGTGWSIRPGAEDRVECRHRKLNPEQEAAAQRLADDAISSGLLEVERGPDMFERASVLSVPADPWNEKQEHPF